MLVKHVRCISHTRGGSIFLNKVEALFLSLGILHYWPPKLGKSKNGEDLVPTMDISEYKRRRFEYILLWAEELRVLLQSSKTSNDALNTFILGQAVLFGLQLDIVGRGNRTKTLSRRFKPSPFLLCRSEHNFSRVQVEEDGSISGRWSP